MKLFVLARGLRLRRERPELFLEGESLGLDPTGEHAERIVAAARRRGAAFALAIVPRLTRALAIGDRPFPLGDVWGDTRVPVPGSAASSATPSRAPASGPRMASSRSPPRCCAGP